MDIVEQLKKSGMPSGLIAGAVEERVPDAFVPKLEAARAFVADAPETQVFLVIGQDSPAKDQYCAALMKWLMVKKNKTGRWQALAKGVDEELGNAGITCIPAFDLLTPLITKQVVSLIREKLSLGRVFIICATSKDSIEQAFGEVFSSFISHVAVSIKIEVEKAEITVL